MSSYQKQNNNKQVLKMEPYYEQESNVAVNVLIYLFKKKKKKPARLSRHERRIEKG